MTRISATVAITGYTVTSGSKPRLKDRIETATVMGEIRTIDNPIVETTTAIMETQSTMLAPQTATLKSDATSPTTMLLSSVSVTTT